MRPARRATGAADSQNVENYMVPADAVFSCGLAHKSFSHSFAVRAGVADDAVRYAQPWSFALAKLLIVADQDKWSPIERMRITGTMRF